jgi:transposase
MEIAADLHALIETLRREVASLRSDVARLTLENGELRRENASLRQENAGLKRRLGLDSSNSGKPPSSDGLGKKPRIAGSLREKSDKKSGGQPGHAGGTLKQTPTPDRVERHEAASCAHCLAALTQAMANGAEKRQVFDLPPPRLVVVEHQAMLYACAGCGRSTTAAFPEGVRAPTQYGPGVRAAAVYLNTWQLLPEDRAAQAMGDLLGAHGLCPASVAAWSAARARELAPVVETIGRLVEHAPVRHLDETGFRIAGKTRWLHVASTPELTHYRVSEKRGALPAGLVGGVVVHDHFKAYYSQMGHLLHGLCNAHHLRELKGLIEIEKEPWAARMSRLLRWASHAVGKAIERGERALAPHVEARFRLLYDATLARGLAFHLAQPPLAKPARGRTARRIGHNLAVRLRDFKSDVLRFLADFDVPFTNNLAERDIRMMKVRMKISGSFRTFAGAGTFASLRSVLSTARKRGWDILRTLASPPDAILAALRA